MADGEEERLHDGRGIEDRLAQHQAEDTDAAAHRQVLLPEGGRLNT